MVRSFSLLGDRLQNERQHISDLYPGQHPNHVSIPIGVFLKLAYFSPKEVSDSKSGPNSFKR